MPLYYYEKYSVIDDYDTVISGIKTDTSPPSSIEGYSNYGSDSNDSGFFLGGSLTTYYLTNGASDTFYYDPEDFDQIAFVMRNASYNSAGELVYQEYTKSYNGKVKNNYIETLTAEDGSYPDNGIQGDYWYEKTTSATPPTLLEPNGGELINDLFTISWQLAVPDSQTQIQLSNDNGSTWKDIITTSAGTTSYEYNFINEVGSSVCLIRVRSYESSTLYSEWDVSDGVFTIQHNESPTVPTGLNPVGGEPINRALTTRFSWDFNDINYGDGQSEFTIQWRLKGASNWNEITQSSTNTFYDMPGGVLPHGEVEWRVLTKDEEGLASPYSNIAVFMAADKPDTPVITSPGSTVPVPNPTVQWSSPEQVSFRLRLLQDSVEVYTAAGGENKAQTIQYDLENNQTYTFELHITNEDGLESDAATLTMNVSYDPPAAPVLSLITNGAQGQAVLTIDHPAPGPTQPNVVSVDVFRRASGEDWIRLFSGLPPTEDYVDHTLGSGTEYEFYVRAWGDNETYIDSPIVRGQLKLKSIWLHDPDDESSLYQFKCYEPQRSASMTLGGGTRQFEGRPLPVADYSGTETHTVSPVLQLMGNDLQVLQELVRRQKTLLYRDNRGRRLFCAIFGVPQTDEFWGSTVPIEVLAVDYREGM